MQSFICQIYDIYFLYLLGFWLLKLWSSVNTAVSSGNTSQEPVEKKKLQATTFPGGFEVSFVQLIFFCSYCLFQLLKYFVHADLHLITHFFFFVSLVNLFIALSVFSLV